jgi:hypothetical protein
MSYRFQVYDAGKGKRNWDEGDCTVRAVSTALALSYSEAWQLLYDLQGEHKSCGFRLAEFLRRSPDRLRVVRSIPCKAKRGVSRMNGRTFTEAYPKGRYLLRMAHHFVAVVDGVYFDSWLSDGKCVYCAWEVS